MTTQTLIKKLHKEVSTLQKDMQKVKKTLLMMPQRDPEGEYRPAFVKKMLERAQSKGPFYRFTDKESFLKYVRSKK